MPPRHAQQLTTNHPGLFPFLGAGLSRAGLAIVLTFGLALNGWSQTNDAAPQSLGHQTVVLPQSIPDPLEPVNRAMWELNKGVMTGVVQPTAKVYRFIVRKPIRAGIRNFGRNITYPGRLMNHLLQARWVGARDESYRFGCNTVLGLGGFIDVASLFKIPKSEADFGQTLGRWGWEPACFLMLPFFGPSSERDLLGLVGDTAANPLAYFSPYPFDPSRPLTYLSPASYYGYVVTYNNLSETVDNYVRFSKAEMDAYSELQYAWGFMRRSEPIDFQLSGPPDSASLETLQSAFFSFKNPEFPRNGRTKTVLILRTGKDLKFTYWLQPNSAPIVYIVPGLGSHRLTPATLALAELAFNNGFSVVSVSSPFNHEFMEHAATTPVPGYTPVDAADLHRALTLIDLQLERMAPGRIGSRALLGYSMGGFQTLFLAATTASTTNDLLRFDRFVAINTPVRLLYGMSRLDAFFQAPLEWPADQRTDRIENTFMKVAALTEGVVLPEPIAAPFSAVESKFLIGVAFRLILRDAIYTSQLRYNQGVLTEPLRKFRRKDVYEEILRYSFQEYFARFVTPYYLDRGVEVDRAEAMVAAGDLRSYVEGLAGNKNVRLLLNRNDFLLSDADLEWLRATFGERATVFDSGGHLGNLFHPDVQNAIVRALSDLSPAR